MAFQTPEVPRPYGEGDLGGGAPKELAPLVGSGAKLICPMFFRLRLGGGGIVLPVRGTIARRPR